MGATPSKKEFHCPACHQDTWLSRTPLYESFTKTGETLRCALCHHVFASEQNIPFKESGRPKVFREEDKPRAIRVFREDEKGRICRYCAEYVVNPFLQRCGLTNREVQATDMCDRFAPKPDPPSDSKVAEPEDPFTTLLPKKSASPE